MRRRAGIVVEVHDLGRAVLDFFVGCRAPKCFERFKDRRDQVRDGDVAIGGWKSLAGHQALAFLRRLDFDGAASRPAVIFS